MTTLLDEIPIYEKRPVSISAEHFNSVQIALKRIASTIRFELPKLRTLDLVLDKDDWVVVDRSLNDIPVIAWTEFQSEGRLDLHHPIACQLQIYHQHATIIIEKVMEAMELIIGEKLDEKFPDTDDTTVTPISGRN